MKKCKTCNKWLEDELFPMRENNRRRPHCNECSAKKRKREYYTDRTKRVAQNRANKLARRAVLTEYTYNYLLNNPCVDCGESNPMLLEFDHLHSKKYNISEILWQILALDTLKNEIDKCEVRCANCHRKKTAREFLWWSYVRASTDGYA